MSKRGAATTTSATTAPGGDEEAPTSKRPRVNTSNGKAKGQGSTREVVMAIESELKGTPAPSADRLVEIMIEMDRIGMTHELLAQTGIAKLVGKLRKNTNTQVGRGGATYGGARRVVGSLHVYMSRWPRLAA